LSVALTVVGKHRCLAVSGFVRYFVYIDDKQQWANYTTLRDA
jgi:hypothetical protein